MRQLLTAKQIQDLLHVDRTTIYRMLKDGRLTGIKIGNQWRFSENEIRELMADPSSGKSENEYSAAELLPWQSIQPAQDVLAELADIGSVVTSCAGNPLTRMSNSCDFCRLIQQSETGRKACSISWGRLAHQSSAYPEFATCHAGLQYARAKICLSGQTIALLIGGQFTMQDLPPAEREAQARRLAAMYQIDAEELVEASGRIRLKDEQMANQIGNWLGRVASTFEQVGRERTELLSRLHHISEMSQLINRFSDPDLPAKSDLS